MKLTPLRGLKIRPTSDKVREAIFNLLGTEVEDFRVLDLFAGSGALGIEAMSRGAQSTLFIDNSLGAIRVIKKNLYITGLEKNSTVIKKDLRRGLSWLKESFHLVFIDPPYGKGLYQVVLSALIEGDILEPSAFVVVESRRLETLPKGTKSMILWKQKIYGDTKITIYKKEKQYV